MDTQTFNAVFWSFFITSTIGCLLKIGSLLYKSKCKEVNFCCIKIIRDIETELKEDELEIKNKVVSEKKNDT